MDENQYYTILRKDYRTGEEDIIHSEVTMSFIIHFLEHYTDKDHIIIIKIYD